MAKLGGILLVLACLASVIFWFLHTPQMPGSSGATTTPQSLQTFTQSSVSGSALPREVPAGFKEFRSQQFHFSLFYSDDLEVRQKAEYEGQAFTVVLFNKTKGEALQVYVQPYNLPTISEERFKLDAPYASHTNPQKINFAGAEGLIFVGHNPGSPDMREIWFINGGLLYEVTVPDVLNDWAQTLLDTWMFVQ